MTQTFQMVVDELLYNHPTIGCGRFTHLADRDVVRLYPRGTEDTLGLALERVPYRDVDVTDLSGSACRIMGKREFVEKLHRRLMGAFPTVGIVIHRGRSKTMRYRRFKRQTGCPACAERGLSMDQRMRTMGWTMKDHRRRDATQD